MGSPSHGARLRDGTSCPSRCVSRRSGGMVSPVAITGLDTGACRPSTAVDSEPADIEEHRSAPGCTPGLSRRSRGGAWSECNRVFGGASVGDIRTKGKRSQGLLRHMEPRFSQTFENELGSGAVGKDLASGAWAVTFIMASMPKTPRRAC